MGRSVPRIYVVLDNKQGEFQSHMIQVEGMIKNHSFTILINSVSSHSYIDPKVVEILQFPRCKNEKYWLVQLAIGSKRNIVELVKSCPLGMNGMNTKVDMNLFPLVSYHFLIGMDWLEQHHAILDYHKKAFTFLDE
jgi:hypothetical protein